MLEVAQYLTKNGYIVITAQDAAQARDILKKYTFDICILDIMMPAMDGVETLRALKRNPETSSIPVIMLTVKKETKLIMDVQNLGAADYIPKPFLFEDLLKSIKRQI